MSCRCDFFLLQHRYINILQGQQEIESPLPVNSIRISQSLSCSHMPCSMLWLSTSSYMSTPLSLAIPSLPALLSEYSGTQEKPKMTGSGKWDVTFTAAPDFLTLLEVSWSQHTRARQYRLFPGVLGRSRPATWSRGTAQLPYQAVLQEVMGISVLQDAH